MSQFVDLFFFLDTGSSANVLATHVAAPPPPSHSDGIAHIVQRVVNRNVAVPGSNDTAHWFFRAAVNAFETQPTNALVNYDLTADLNHNLAVNWSSSGCNVYTTVSLFILTRRLAISL